ncbi:MAG: phytoene/squalene synthase family protein [Candidatus Saccharimonadales bacterium]
METYDLAAQQAARVLTHTFSTSFSRSIYFFKPRMRQHIYNLYGLVRVADEVVDSYHGKDALAILNKLEDDTYQAIKTGYSSNVIIHAFLLTAQQADIGKELIKPFFDSMRMDIEPRKYHASKDYEKYIYGSAEVVGLMCLKVFCMGDKSGYQKLQQGAKALGSAFQKINFLRDIADDYKRLGRYYFPVGSFATFDDSIKSEIVADINLDMKLAKTAMEQLPKDAQTAVCVAYEYFATLLTRLSKSPAKQLKKERLRVSNPHKRWIIGSVIVRQKIRGK